MSRILDTASGVKDPLHHVQYIGHGRRVLQLDERDRHVTLLATRAGYDVTQTGVVSMMCMAIVLPKVWVAFGVFTTLVFAEVARHAAQLHDYRPGG